MLIRYWENIGENEIGNEGAIFISNMLRENKSLTHLYLCILFKIKSENRVL